MKFILPLLMLFSSSAFAQKKDKPKTDQSTKSTQVQLPRISIPTITLSSSLNKKIHPSDSTKYYISDSVQVTNGKEEKVKVLFEAVVPIKIWDVKSAMQDEKLYFSEICSSFSIKAQYTLKNSLSFEPFKKQFFMWEDSRSVFICNFKMMGRNGYGNLIEGSSLVEYSGL
jgi:hypothetical protein